MLAALTLSEIVAPQVGLEPTTLRLRLIQSFRSGADYLINFLICEKVVGRSREYYWLGLLNSSVSARSCLLQNLSTSFAQDHHANLH